jgi:hypothetical protein
MISQEASKDSLMTVQMLIEKSCSKLIQTW